MDCLDRTNVVQAYLAAESLAKILASLGVLNAPSVTELEGNSHFQNIYRNAWADHGNLIAVQYAGTGALKTDYTRTGVRTHWGVAQVCRLAIQIRNSKIDLNIVALSIGCRNIH